MFKYLWLQYFSKNYRNSKIIRTDSKTFAEHYGIQINDQIICKKDVCFIIKKRNLACINFFLSGHLVMVPIDEVSIARWRKMFKTIEEALG